MAQRVAPSWVDVRDAGQGSFRGRAETEAREDGGHDSNRPAIRVGVDWTEQAHHLAGGLGAAVLQRFLEMDRVRRTDRPRELEVTDVGAGQLGDVLAPA